MRNPIHHICTYLLIQFKAQYFWAFFMFGHKFRDLNFHDYVKNRHEAIISPEVFDLAQNKLKNRVKSMFNYSCMSPFSSKIVCGECGGFYGSKVWHSNDKYRKVIWQCNNKFKNKEKCKTPHLTEEQMKEEFVKAFNNLVSNKEEVIKDCENTVLSLVNT